LGNKFTKRGNVGYIEENYRITRIYEMHHKLRVIFALALSPICDSALWADELKKTVTDLTFAEPIASIVYDHCSSCHRPGQSGPFSLLTYADVSQRAETIQAVIRDGYMPPWKAVHTGIDFSNDRRLSDLEKKQLTEWIDAKCPEGDATKTPTAPRFPDGWSLGTPDMVVRMDQPFRIPADGPDLYRSFVFPVNLPEDKWVKAIELRPTARGAVHHALFFLDIDGAAREQKSLDGQPGFAGMNFLKTRGNSLERLPENLSRGLGGFVPGATPHRLPGDLARYLPMGSDIIMQTHFHPSGKPDLEQAELGLYFADRAPKQKLVAVQMPPVFGMGASLEIPAGKSDFVLHDEYVLPIDILGFEIGGHAHYICREMTMTATPPTGKAIELLRINDWDLDWQDQYMYKTPVALPKGTKLTVDITYDNSAMNPENPFSPPRDISWGRESNDEMGSITMLVLAADENERSALETALQDRSRVAFGNRIKSQMGRMGGLLGGGNGAVGPFVRLLDRNRDGMLQKSELPAKFRDRLLDLMDSNNDDQIDKSEMESSRKEIDRLLERMPKGK
jgi:mono/diheme cytochrome c family protein